MKYYTAKKTNFKKSQLREVFDTVPQNRTLTADHHDRRACIRKGKFSAQRECSATEEKASSVWKMGLGEYILLKIPLLLYIYYLYSEVYIENRD